MIDFNIDTPCMYIHRLVAAIIYILYICTYNIGMSLFSLMCCVMSTSSLNMCPLLPLQLCTYHSQQNVGGDGDEQGEESVDG